MKRIIIPATIMLSITALGIKKYNNYQNEQLIDKVTKSEYNYETMLEAKQEEINDKNSIAEQIDNASEDKR